MSIMVTRPADKAVAITPSNSTDLTTPTRGIYVGVSGDLTVDLVKGGTQITFVGLAAGIIHPIAAKRVYATGTDATDILGILN
jgi:hypothetical protein